MHWNGEYNFCMQLPKHILWVRLQAMLGEPVAVTLLGMANMMPPTMRALQNRRLWPATLSAKVVSAEVTASSVAVEKPRGGS